MSPSLVTPTADSVRGPAVCGSQCSAADPLTVDHTVRVSHRLQTTVDDHSLDPSVNDHFR